MSRHLILGIGELLWDILPAGAMLGGAPANFSVMAGRLGDHAALLSRIGRDELGRRAIDLLDPMEVDTSRIEIDPAHETGRVTVSFTGVEPGYTIHEPAAWDFMELTDDWMQLAERGDAVCFGSLAQRCPRSRQTIQAIVAQTGPDCVRVFDVNLRPPYYSREIIEESLDLFTVFKMNAQEVPLVLRLLDMETQSPNQTLRMGAQRLLEEFPRLKMVVITRGASGSLLVTRDEWHDHPGYKVKVADTIGAGDAFTAGLTHFMLRGAGLARLNEAGNRWGSWMAAQTGAMPAMPDAVRDRIEIEIAAQS